MKKKPHKALFRIQKSHQTLNSINDGICIRIYLKSPKAVSQSLKLCWSCMYGTPLEHSRKFITCICIQIFEREQFYLIQTRECDSPPANIDVWLLSIIHIHVANWCMRLFLLGGRGMWSIISNKCTWFWQN